jgi:hypothetical protein
VHGPVGEKHRFTLVSALCDMPKLLAVAVMLAALALAVAGPPLSRGKGKKSAGTRHHGDNRDLKQASVLFDAALQPRVLSIVARTLRFAWLFILYCTKSDARSGYRTTQLLNSLRPQEPADISFPLSDETFLKYRAARRALKQHVGAESKKYELTNQETKQELRRKTESHQVRIR